MTSTTSRDLGHGVRVMPGDGDGIVVQSSDFDFGWRPRMGERPGAAVMWEGSSVEVVEREPWRRGWRWTLAPWRGEDVMRVVLPLDDAAVHTAAVSAETAVRARKLRPWFWLLSPLLGFAAAPWQLRWRDELSFPATLATWLSAIFELVVGAACLLEFIAAIGGGITIFPWIPRWVTYFGLIFFVEGLVRLVQVAADSEPVGSFLGFLISFLERREPPTPEPIDAPSLQTYDEVGGVLEFVSTILRRDWEEPGLLSYRGDLFALDSTERLGESWVYVFGRLEVAENWDGPRLRLIPPRSKVVGRSFAGEPGLIKTGLLTIACTLAPRRFQERWASELGVGEKWFTVMGASAELLGGLSNLGASEVAPAPIVLLNLFFVGEAVVRFGSLVLRGHPLGSVLGLPLAPILERYLPDVGSPSQVRPEE